MKSIILLAMSTLNANVFSKSPGDDFSVAGETDTQIKDCKSQLEPVIRYFLKDEQCTDTVEVLMLCTRQTLEIATDSYGEKYKDEEEKEINNVSAVTFLMDRINNCPEIIINNCPEKKKEITYKAFPLYRERIKESLPKIDCKVVLDNTDKSIEELKTKKNALAYARAYEEAYPPDYLSGIRETIQTIRNVVKANRNGQQNQTTPFYIVTHGGPRDVMLSLNAVISLLDEEGIEPTKICGTNLATKMIEDQKASFDMFRFVSGMRDFINFGSVKVLGEYFAKNMPHSSSEDGIQEDNRNVNNNIITAMQRVSDGMQFSNPTEYKEGLDQLYIELTKPDANQKEGILNQSILGIFRENIEQDYGILLDNEKRTIIDIIAHCLKKGQCQQALTFLESYLPEYYTKNKILYFDGQGNDLFNKYILGIRFKENNDNCSENAYVYKEVMGKEGEHWENIDDNLLLQYCYQKRIKEKNEILREANTKFDLEDFKNKVLPVLKMHRVLKKTRNSFNHAHEEYRIPEKKLVEYTKTYLNLLKQLRKD